MRTSIDECYNRCIERYLKNYPNCTDKELEEYRKRKIKIYKGYHITNEFLKKVDALLPINS